MLKGIVLTLLIVNLVAYCDTVPCLDCFSSCQTCSKPLDPYSCLTCFPGTAIHYLRSCSNDKPNLTPTIIIGIGITILHIFLLSMGIGIYRQLFECIQLATLVSWRYGFDNATFGFQITNLTLVYNNQFVDIFEKQFIIIICALIVFWFLLVIRRHEIHHPFTILLRRKKIIFPVRIFSTIYNILLYGSIAQYVNAPSDTSPYQTAIASIGVIFSIGILIFFAVICNWSRFQSNNLQYYILVQKLATQKRYARNNLLISLIFRTIVLVSFVSLFQSPVTAGLILIISQVLYSFYVIGLLRYIKLRYFIIIIACQLLMFAIFLVILMANSATIGSSSWIALGTAHTVFMWILIGLFILSSIFEVMIQRDILVKQIKSIYSRFIRCENFSNEVAKNRYDQNSRRQRVTEFKTNLLYQGVIPSIQMRRI